jgi:tetratricopeptide (TPR) repeat protein
MSRIVFAIVLAFILVFAVSSYADDSKVTPKWNYNIGSRIDSLAIGDVGSDGTPELVVASDKGIYIFSGNGSIIKNYSISFTPSVAYISEGNILVGSGDIVTTNITNPVFNFTDKDNIVQIPSVLYKTIRNRGSVYIISGNSQPKLLLSTGEWVRDIRAEDVNGDSALEYAVVTGGINEDFIKNARLEEAPRELVKSTRFDSDYDQCDDWIKTVTNGFQCIVQCAFIEGQNYMEVNVTPLIIGMPPFKTTFKSYDDQCSTVIDSIRSYYLNMTATCDYIRQPSRMGGGSKKVYYSGYMELNITQPPRLKQIWKYSYEEIYSNNGSLLFFSNGSVELNKTFTYIPEYVSLVSFSANTSKMLAFGSEPVNVTDLYGTVVWSYDSPEENYTVKALYTDSIRGEKLNDIVAGFAAAKVSGVFVLDRDGRLVWVYKVASEDFKGLYSRDIDSDGTQEVIFATNKGVYIIGKDGLLMMSFNFAKSIDKLAIGDMDGNNYIDFAVASGQETYVYEVDDKFIKSGLANRYYADAKGSLELGNFDAALASIGKAESLYKELSDDDGVRKSASLLTEIKESMKGVRNETAASLYKKGRTEFYLGNYNQSREYLGKALEIYNEIGDSDGMTKTKNAIAELDAVDTPGTTSPTTSVVDTTLVGNTTNPDTPTDISQYLPLLIGVILLFLVIIIVKMVLGGRGGPKEEGKEKDIIQRS